MRNKVLVNQNKMASFVCPECGLAKIVNVARHMDAETAVTVKFRCPCGFKDNMLLERRKDYRHKVELQGQYTSYDGKFIGYVVIKDLSKSGLKMELFQLNEEIQVGDKLYVSIELDNHEQSRVRKDVIVRNIKGFFIGAEFCEKEHYGILGPYLMYRCG